jgi:hypothetical protein
LAEPGIGLSAEGVPVVHTKLNVLHRLCGIIALSTINLEGLYSKEVMQLLNNANLNRRLKRINPLELCSA